MRFRRLAVLVTAAWWCLAPAHARIATAINVDTTPPTFTVGFPARGEFVSGAAAVTIRGTADDPGSGVASVEVNGQAAALTGSEWSLPATLDFGTNTFTLRVTDGAGNVAHTSWSAIYSPGYRPASEPVASGAAARLTPGLVERLASSAVLAKAVAATAGTVREPIRIDSLTFGAPQAAVTLVQEGFRTVIDIPNLTVDASLFGVELRLSAAMARVDGVLTLAVAQGAFEVSMPAPPVVTFSAVTWDTGPRPRPLVARALAAALQTSLPPALAPGLNRASGPFSRSAAGTVVTFEFVPRELAVDAGGAQVAFDAHVTAARDPQAPPSPGSPARGGGAPPVFATPHDVSVAVNEDFLNQMVHAAWQAGAGRLRIDQAFLDAHGISLPFPLDASFLVPFFPQLAALTPAGQAAPIAFELDAALPPVVEVTGAPDLLGVSLGELGLSVLLDRGSGFAAVLSLVVHTQMGTSVGISNGQLLLSVGKPTRLVVELLENPFGLELPDVNGFLQTTLPLIVSLASGFIPPIPLPMLPPGFKLSNIDIRQDGPGADYVTVEGDF